MFYQSPASVFKASFPGQFSSSKASGGRNLNSVLNVLRRGTAWARGVFPAVAMLLLGALGGHVQAQTLVTNWYQELPANSPSARFTHGMAYDSAHGHVVVFGGFTASGITNDTWLWNGTNWTLAHPAVSPSPRDNAYMTYDAAHGQVVLFGGSDSSGNRLGDTWLWDGVNWTQASAATNPPGRNGHALIYDALHGQVLMFGGVSTSGFVLGDTWVWNGTNWIAQAPTASPAARFNESMVYDAAHSQVMLFGGSDGDKYLNDTWIWNGANWVQQAPATSPSTRYAASMAYDAALGEVVLFGGYNGSYFNDTWLWSGSNWNQDSAVNSPSPRYFPNAMAYDSAHNQVLMFGGSSGGSDLGDTWVFGLPGSFGSANVCPAGQTTPSPCSNTIAFNYLFASGATLGTTPTVVTQGGTGLDFSLASGSTCSGTVAPGTCTVNVTFAPVLPGLRTGAIQLLDTGGNIVATTLLSGVGQGPAVSFGPGVQSVLPLTGLHYNVGITVDATGNTYVADYVAREVVKYTSGGVQSTVSLGGLGVTPIGVAVDGAGNLYVADLGVTYVYKVTPSGAATKLGSGLNNPIGVALDAAGNIFVGDKGNNRVVEITPGGVQTTVPFTGLSQPSGVAVDAQGDVFVADGGNSRVLEITPGGIQTTVTTTGLGASYGVAVDAAGDVYIADPANARVLEVPADGSPQTTVGAGLNYPSGVTVDGAGNVLIGDQGAGQVLKVNRSQPPSLSFAATDVSGTSSDSPQSVTLQNVGNQTLNAVSPGLLVVNGPSFVNVAGPGTPVDCSTSAALTPGAGCNLSLSFTPQAAGNPLTSTAVFHDNALNAPAGAQTINLSGVGVSAVTIPLFLFPIGGGTGTVTDNAGLINCSEAATGAVGTCTGNYAPGTQVTLTATPTGTSTFTGWGGVCASAGTNITCTVTVNQVSAASPSFVDQNFGSYNVCPVGQPIAGPCSNSFPVTFVLPTATTIGAIQVVTQGATGLDFSQGGGSTCVGLIAAGNSCVVNVHFAPTAPGLRMGAVQMFDNNGNLVASTPIYGVGQEAEIAFGPGTPRTVDTGSFTLSQPKGMLVDAAGNLFISDGDPAVPKVIKIAPNGTKTLVGVGLQFPQGMAEDGAGNLYIADNNLNQVVEVPAGCTNGGCQQILGANLRSQLGVAVDGAGSVFIGDFLDGKVVKSPAGCTTSACQTVVYNPGGGSNPVGLMVDSLGNLFVTDFGLKTVTKVPAGCTISSCPVAVGSGWSQPDSVSVDAAGDVFVADAGLQKVVEVPAGCTSAGCQIVVASGVNTVAVTTDSFGNLYFDDLVNRSVIGINRSQPSALGFALTNVGSTSTDSPKQITVQNIGNQPLTGSLALNLGGNFAQNSTTDCSALSLAPGAICSESFSFTPLSATFAQGTAVFSDNSLNIVPATQTVTLSGTGAVGGVAGTVAVPNVVGQAQTAVTAPIAAVGLVSGTVSTASSSTVPSGTVISQNPVAGTQVAVGSAVNLLVSSGTAQPPSPNPLLLENNYFVTGDYVSAGVSLRGLGVGGVATRNINIPSYAQSPTQGVPDGADIVDAFLYWETLESTSSASSASGTFNGYSIIGQQIGKDLPNYVDGNFTGMMRAYRASVNAYLPVGANGVRIVSGAYSVSLPDSGGAVLPLTEGASLVMVYRVLSPNFPLKAVVLYDGSAAPAVTGIQVMKGFYDATGGANGTGKNTNLFASAGAWNNSVNLVTLGQADQFSATLNPASAYAAVILSTPVNNSDNDGVLDAWKTGPAAGDFHAGQPGYYDAKTGTWVGLPGAKHGHKDLFVQLDYMCGAVLASGACDPTQENLFPSPDASGNDPLLMIQKAFTASGVQLHLQIGNAVPEDTCTDDLTTSPATLCQFPSQAGVIGWKNSLEFSKLWPRNLAACISGGDCTTRFPYGQKDSYHYVLLGHSLAIPAWNTRYGTLTSISVANGVTTIGTVDRGTGINKCPSRITLAGVLGNPSLNGVYNTTGCADTKTITLATPSVLNWSYPNSTLPEPVIGLTSGTITSISGYSDLGGADSAVTLGLWLTAPNQDMSKKANVVAGTLFHEIGHTLGLSHGGLYYDTPGSYVPMFEANCKPNYQSVMNYLFQLDLVGPNQAIAFSNQTLNTLNENSVGSTTQLTDLSNNPATFPTSAWYVPFTAGSLATPATRHCDGTPLAGDSAYRVDASIAPVTPAWSNGQDINFIGSLQTKERGFNDLSNMDLRQVGATGGQFASLASILSFGASVAPLNITAGGNVALGSGGTVALGSGGTVTLGSGGNVTLGSAGTIALGSGGTVTLGSGGTVTLGSAGTVTPGAGGTVTLGSAGNVTLGSAGTITLGSGGTVTLGSAGTVTLGSGGTIALGDGGGTVTIPSSGGSYSIDGSGGTITLGSAGTVTLGSGGTVTLGSAGTITLGSGGNVTLGSAGTVTLGSGGTVTLGSAGTIALGSGGNVTLGSAGTITLGSGGTITLGSAGNVTLGSGGTVTLGSAGNVALGSAGTVTLGSGGSATLGAGGTVTLGSGGTVTLGSAGTVTLGSAGTIALGSGGTVALGSAGTVTLGSAGTITLGSGGTITLGSAGTVTLGSAGTVTLSSGGVPIPVAAGGTVTLGSGGTVTLGSAGNVTLGSGGTVTLGSAGTITLGSAGTVALGSAGTVTLGSAGTITLGSGGTITLGSAGTVTLGSGGVVTLGNGGSVMLGSGSTAALETVSNITPASAGPVANDELTYETANSVVRPPALPTQTPTPAGVRITWKAPAFGVVQTYTIYRSSNGATPIAIGSVSGVNGFPPATEFTDTNPDLGSQTVIYTISTTLVPDTAGAAPRQSQPSPPAVLKNDQSITLGPLPSSVTLSNPPTVTATAMSGGVPNGLQVVFSSTGSCAIGRQTVLNNISSATVTLSGTGSCTITASQPGTTTINAANSVSGMFVILPQGSGTKSQTITFAPLPNAQYGGTFSLNASSSAGLPVSFLASGPCTTIGTISAIGVCTITASVPANDTYSAASLTQSFTIYPAVLKVTANNFTIAYGQPIPALTYAYSGFVNTDTPLIVNGAPALSTTASASSNPGIYPIAVSTGTLATANYSFLYVNGAVTVQMKSQTITFTTNPPASAVYNTSFTVAATASSGGAVTFTSAGACSNSGATYTMTSSVGTCSVIASQAGSAAYSAAQVTKTVAAIGPVLSVSTSSIDFGTVFQGSISTKNITLTNIGTAPVTIKDPVLSVVRGGNSNEFLALSLCPRPLAVGKSCTVTIAFLAGPFYTPQTATLQIISNAPGSPQPVALTASVIAPYAVFSPPSLSFGTIRKGTSSTLNVTLRNSVGTPLLLTGISVTGANTSSFVQSNTCGSSLAAGGSCTIAVKFTPAAAGTFNASLKVVDNAQSGGGTQTVALLGKGN